MSRKASSKRAFSGKEEVVVEAAASEVGKNFVLISEDVTELEASVLGDDVVGEPLSYQDNNLGWYQAIFQDSLILTIILYND